MKAVFTDRKIESENQKFFRFNGWETKTESIEIEKIQIG